MRPAPAASAPPAVPAAALIALAGAAALVRLAWQSAHHEALYWNDLGDSAIYREWARAIAAGAPPGGPFFMAPLYPYFLAFLDAAAGIGGRGVMVVQALLGGVQAALVATIALRVARPGYAWLAGALWALYQPAIAYSASLLAETLGVSLILLHLWLVLLAAERPGTVRAGVAGLAGGLAVLARSEAALLVVASALGGSRRNRLAVLAAALLAVAPASLHNLATGGTVQPSTNAGLNLWIGWGPGADGGYRYPPAFDPGSDPHGLRLASSEARRELDAAGASRHWTRRSLAVALDDPLRAVRLAGHKALLLTGRYEVPQAESLAAHPDLAGVAGLPLAGFGVLGPLGLAGLGLVAARARRDVAARIVALAAAAAAAPPVLVFVLGRLRLSLAALLAVAAAALVEALGHGERHRRLLALAALALTAVLVHLPGAERERLARDRSDAADHEGIRAQRAGRLDLALAAHRRAAELDPGNARPWSNLAALHARRGEHAEAEAAARAALARDPLLVPALSGLARLLADSGRGGQARALLDDALAREPRLLSLWLRLAEIERSAGDLPAARRTLDRALAVAPADRPLAAARAALDR